MSDEENLPASVKVSEYDLLRHLETHEKWVKAELNRQFSSDLIKGAIGLGGMGITFIIGSAVDQYTHPGSMDYLRNFWQNTALGLGWGLSLAGLVAGVGSVIYNLRSINALYSKPKNDHF